LQHTPRNKHEGRAAAHALGTSRELQKQPGSPSPHPCSCEDEERERGVSQQAATALPSSERLRPLAVAAVPCNVAQPVLRSQSCDQNARRQDKLLVAETHTHMHPDASTHMRTHTRPHGKSAHPDRPTHQTGGTYIQGRDTGTSTDRQINTQAGRPVNRQAGRSTDRQTSRQAGSAGVGAETVSGAHIAHRQVQTAADPCSNLPVYTCTRTRTRTPRA
jgi:hypothetical protein